MKQGSFTIYVPENREDFEQGEEQIIVNYKDDNEKICFHDYDKIYNIPGLYEEVFQNRMQCRTPDVIIETLEEMAEKYQEFFNNGLRIFELGAGNGVIGERLSRLNCEFLYGVDIIPEAKKAAMRDRPETYSDYHIIDMCSPDKCDMEDLRGLDFNTLIIGSALGFNDIPPEALINAFNLIADDGIIIFNIKDDYVSDDDYSGFNVLIKTLEDECMDNFRSRLYCHRKLLNGSSVYYRAISGQKIKDLVLDEAVL